MSKFPTHNPYFNASGKDVWSLINESAAHAGSQTDREIINLGQGFFSYSPPQFVIDAAKDALNVPMNNQYAHTKGKPSLLNAISKTYTKRYGREIGIDEILVTTGANEALLTILTGFLQKGDEVIVFEPFFDQYISNIEIPGGKVVYVPMHPPKEISERNVKGEEWKIDFQELEAAITPKTKFIILNTPHNPVGKIFTKEELTQIGELAVKHNILIISDEVYENLYYGGEFPRIATLSPDFNERTFSIFSAGKSFAATGWRIGWIIGNPELIKYAALAHTRICFSSPAPLQEACATALIEAGSNGYFEKTRSEYHKKYEIFTKVWEELGLPYTVADGAYYLLVDFSKVKVPEDYEYPDTFKARAKDFRLAYWLINELGVVSIPPTEFYIKEHEKVAENLLRFALCKDDEVLEKAVVRLRELKKYL
jgi:kynurenine aminotransferase